MINYLNNGLAWGRFHAVWRYGNPWLGVIGLLEAIAAAVGGYSN